MSEGLIVIENKINSPEGKDQLPWYEAEARKWHKKNKGRSLLVYLARKKRQTGGDDDQWVSLPYINFASALRDVWLRDRKAAGSAWLGLYISAITHGVLGIDLERPRDTTIAEIEAYIGKATQ
jgi:PD-(D/E)XK nuclease superfamily